MTQSSNWLNSLVANPWFGISGFIIGVLGVILTIVFYFKTRKVKIPCYAIRSLGVVEDITNKSQLLEMYYAKRKIERLTITRVAFWNAGNETIDKRDIAPADPIRMVLKPGYNILDVKLIYEKDKVNQFNFDLQSGNSDVILKFDYLDKHDGAIIQIIHTGEDSKDFEIYGTVKGVGKPRLVYNEVSSKISYEVIISVFGAVAALISTALSGLVSITNNLLVLWLINAIYIIIIGGAIFIIIWQANNFIFKRIPKEFNIFQQESWQF